MSGCWEEKTVRRDEKKILRIIQVMVCPAEARGCAPGLDGGCGSKGDGKYTYRRLVWGITTEKRVSTACTIEIVVAGILWSPTVAADAKCSLVIYLKLLFSHRNQKFSNHENDLRLRKEGSKNRKMWILISPSEHSQRGPNIHNRVESWIVCHKMRPAV